MQPEITLSDVQPTITGQYVDIGAGSTAWGRVPNTPTFSTREAADEWAAFAGFEYDSAEID